MGKFLLLNFIEIPEKKEKNLFLLNRLARVAERYMEESIGNVNSNCINSDPFEQGRSTIMGRGVDKRNDPKGYHDSKG